MGRALPLFAVPTRARRGVRDLGRDGGHARRDRRSAFAIALVRLHARRQRGFCSRCGSTLFFRSGNWPGELHVVHANLDGPADRAPQAHAYWDTHVDWAAVDPADGLKRMRDPKSV